MQKILIVEDDKALGTSLKNLFEEESYQVELASNLEKGSSKLDQAGLVILDWRLPDGQGIDFLKEMRAKGQEIPVIMLTAKTELVDKIIGLESGANDYVTKPFEPRELLARVRAHLRNLNSQKVAQLHSPEVIELGDLSIEPSSRAVIFKGAEVELTKLEYELLVLLATEPNRVFSRDEILNKVWGYENFPTTRTVDTHILQLRQKISDDYFETVRGVGYRLKFAKT